MDNLADYYVPKLGPNRRGNFYPLLGNGIFTSDGIGWEHSRAMMRPQFARDQVSDCECTSFRTYDPGFLRSIWRVMVVPLPFHLYANPYNA